MLYIMIIIGMIYSARGNFCSPICKIGECTGTSEYNCIECGDPFILQGGDCNLPDNSSYKLKLNSGDMTLDRSHNSGSHCSGWLYWGSFPPTDEITVIYAGPISISHFKVRLIVGLLLFDDWSDPTDGITVLLSNLSTTLHTYNISLQTEDCNSNSPDDSYLKLDVQFTHEDTTNPTQFTLIASNALNSSWAIAKQYWMLVQSCHQACLQCTDSTNTSCSQCANGYVLTDSTCDTECYLGYYLNGSVCFPCSHYCVECAYEENNCSSCQESGQYESYLFENQECVVDCPAGYYEVNETHECLLCSDYCVECAYEHNNCSSCQESGSHESYLLENSCLVDCPEGYFSIEETHRCQRMVVSVEVEMELVGEEMRIEVLFSEQMDFEAFPFEKFLSFSFNTSSPSLDRFSFTYQTKNNSAYSLSIIPTLPVSLTDCLLILTAVKPKQPYVSASGLQLDDQIYQIELSQLWTLEKEPTLSSEQQEVVSSLTSINNQINDVLCVQYVQQVKKSGVFLLLLPGAALSSSSLLLHQELPANFYELGRLFGSFVYFDMPEYKKSSTHTKYIFTYPISVANRRLLSEESESDYWQLYRTGMSGYFIYDVYFQVFLLVLCWVLLGLARCCCTHERTVGRMYNIVHTLHYICFYYMWISMLLEWLVFVNEGVLDVVSLGVSIVGLIYFIGYMLWVWGNVMGYYLCRIGSSCYGLFVRRYSFFLRDIRYEEYGRGKWDISHMLRPYNFIILGYYKLMLMICSILLFSTFEHASIICLIIIELMETVRVFLTWPYHSARKNFFILFSELLLLFLFILLLSCSVLSSTMYADLNLITEDQILLYNRMGWASCVLFLLYNCVFIFQFVVDILAGCFYSNRERMEYSRFCYYYKMMETVEAYVDICDDQTLKYFSFDQEISCNEKFHGVELQEYGGGQRDVTQQLILKGNLLQYDYSQLLPKYEMIQQYHITKIKEKYRIRFIKIPQLYFSINPALYEKNMIIIPIKKTGELEINESSTPYFEQIEERWTEMADKIVVKTVLRIQFRNFMPGERIYFREENAIQFVNYYQKNQKLKTITLRKLLPGFPIPLSYL